MPRLHVICFYGWWHLINPIWDVKGGNDFLDVDTAVASFIY